MAMAELRTLTVGIKDPGGVPWAMMAFGNKCAEVDVSCICRSYSLFELESSSSGLSYRSYLIGVRLVVIHRSEEIACRSRER